MQKVLLSTAFVFLGATTQAQWLNYRVAGTPATPDGNVNLSAPAPRAPDGKPDLTGVWHLQTTGQETPLTQGGGSYTGNIFRDLKPEDVPENPAAAMLRAERMK